MQGAIPPVAASTASYAFPTVPRAKEAVVTASGSMPRYVTVHPSGRPVLASITVPYHAVGTSSDASPVHPENALLPTPVTQSGIESAERPVQPEKAATPMPVTGCPPNVSGTVKSPA